MAPVASSQAGSGCFQQAADCERALWQRWRGTRDPQARAALLERHLPYARVVAASYYRRRFHDEIEFDEYLQLASLGLIESMERYDPDGGAQFRTFAARRMHGAILDGLECATEKQQQIAARQRLEEQRQDSIASDGAGTQNQDQLLQHVAQAGLAFALSWLLDGTGMVQSDEPVAQIPFYRSTELRELRRQLLDLVEQLPPQERRVIHGHYLQEQPFEQMAQALGVSRSRVSQLHRQALARLKQSLRAPTGCDILL